MEVFYVMEFFYDRTAEINENQLSQIDVKNLWVKYKFCDRPSRNMTITSFLDTEDYVDKHMYQEEYAKGKIAQLLRTKVYKDKVSVHYFMQKKLNAIDDEEHFGFYPVSYTDSIIAAGYDIESKNFISLRFSAIMRAAESPGQTREMDRGYVIAETFQGDNICRIKESWSGEENFAYASTFPLCEALQQNGSIIQQVIHSKRDVAGYKGMLRHLFPNAVWMMTSDPTMDRGLPESSEYDDFDAHGRHLGAIPTQHWFNTRNLWNQEDDMDLSMQEAFLQDVPVPVRYGALEKFRDLKKVCNHVDDFDEDYLNGVRGLYKLRKSITNRALCNEMRKIESKGYRRCENKIDAISQESVNEIPAPFLYRYRNRCYNILDFDTSSFTSMRDPFTNELLPDEVRQDISSRIQKLQSDSERELEYDDSLATDENIADWYKRNW